VRVVIRDSEKPRNIDDMKNISSVTGY